MFMFNKSITVLEDALESNWEVNKPIRTSSKKWLNVANIDTTAMYLPDS